MTAYSIALFLHIVGAVIYFIALGLEQASLASLRRATLVDQAREWLNAFSWLGRLGPISLILILLSGFYMMATTVGWAAWIIVTLISLVLIAVIGAAIAGPRMGVINQMIAKESGALSSALHQRLSDPMLSISMQIRTAIALGILFLMTVKPDLIGSLITLIVAIILGLAVVYSTLRVARLERSQ